MNSAHEGVACECGASDWQYTGAMKMSNPPLNVMRCADCGREAWFRSNRKPAPARLAAIPASRPPYHLKLRLDCDIGEARLWDGSTAIFNHILGGSRLGDTDKYQDWVSRNLLAEFILVAAMHGVTVEVEEFEDGVVRKARESSFEHEEVEG